MFISDKWEDYELIDASDGERLERWGKYILRRPDPQIIWKNAKKSNLWNKADAVYSRKGGGGTGSSGTGSERKCKRDCLGAFRARNGNHSGAGVNLRRVLPLFLCGRRCTA